MEFRTNKLKKLAEDYIDSEKLVLPSDIKEDDISDIWDDEIYYNMPKHRESSNIDIISPTRDGKSTVGAAISQRQVTGMMKLGLTTRPFGIFNIARTQYEFSKAMRNVELNNTVLMQDEFDDMDSTQANASVEDALLRHFAKIQAGRYVYGVKCSPSNIPNSYSNIILNIDQANKVERKTKCYVYYRLQQGATSTVQVIGHIIIDVNPVIKNWIDYGIEDRFYKEKKTDDDIRFINKWRKEDWYVEYVCRKFEKMEMLNKMGIFVTRDLDYSDIYLECIKNLKGMTRLKGLVTPKKVKNQLKILFRKHLVPTSIIGDQIMTDKVDGTLSYWSDYYDQERTLKYLAQSLRAGKIEEDEYNEQRMIIEGAMQNQLEAARREEEELETLSKLKRRFYGE